MPKFDKFKKFATVVFTIVGVIVTISEFLALVEDKEKREISFANSEKDIYSPSDIFDVKALTSDKNDLPANKKLFQTVFTIWNTGNTTIKESDIRLPFKIMAGTDSIIVGSKVMEIKSSLDNNFTFSQISEKEAILKWKLFDPGMGVQIAVLQSGFNRTLSLKADMGPNAKLVRFSSYTWRSWIATIVFISIFLVIAFYLTRAHSQIITNSRAVEPARRNFLQKHSFLTFLIGGFIYGLVLIISIYLFGFMLGITNRPDSPIETQDFVGFILEIHRLSYN